MKKNLIFIVIVLFSFSCDKNEIQDVLPTSSTEESVALNLKSAEYELGTPDVFCNTEKTVFELIAGKKINSGIVSIVNDENNLYVTYETIDGLALNEIHVYVGDKEGIPTTRSNTPIPGNFPYKIENINNNEITIVIPLSDITVDCPLILTHAALSNGETAWGWDNDETHTFEVALDTKRWGYLGEYCIYECDEDMYLTMKYWIKLPDGNRVYGTMEPLEQFYFEEEGGRESWCNKMGVVKVDDDEDITLNLLMTGFSIIGTINISKQESTIIANIELNDHYSDEYKLNIYNLYCFYGTLEELESYGSCPNFESFPYIYENDYITNFEILLN